MFFFYTLLSKATYNCIQVIHFCQYMCSLGTNFCTNCTNSIALGLFELSDSKLQTMADKGSVLFLLVLLLLCNSVLVAAKKKNILLKKCCRL